MKKWIIVAVLAFFYVGAFAETTIESAEFKAGGSCGMCRTRIERTAVAVEGVQSAKWDRATQTLKIEFNSDLTSSDAVQVAIAAVGHDTDDHKADDAVYKKLPGCCKYRK
jgi:copper chaperone CopZ